MDSRAPVLRRPLELHVERAQHDVVGSCDPFMFDRITMPNFSSGSIATSAVMPSMLPPCWTRYLPS